MKKRISRKPDSSATPIFFRSRLFPAISHASPSFLIDMLRPKDEDMKDSEQSVYLSVYNMTYRYDPNSKWVQVIQEFIEVVSPSEKLGPEDTEEGGEPEPENIAALTRVSQQQNLQQDIGCCRHGSTHSMLMLLYILAICFDCRLSNGLHFFL